MNLLLDTQLRDVAQRVGSRGQRCQMSHPASPRSSCSGSPMLALHQSPEPLLFLRFFLPLRVNVGTRRAWGRSALSGICSSQLTCGKFQTAYVHLKVVIWRLLGTLWESAAFFWTALYPKCSSESLSPPSGFTLPFLFGGSWGMDVSAVARCLGTPAGAGHRTVRAMAMAELSTRKSRGGSVMYSHLSQFSGVIDFIFNYT